MAIITAEILEGRDIETKALLIEELRSAFDRVCGHGDTLYVVINEVSETIGESGVANWRSVQNCSFD